MTRRSPRLISSKDTDLHGKTLIFWVLSVKSVFIRVPNRVTFAVLRIMANRTQKLLRALSLIGGFLDNMAGFDREIALTRQNEELMLFLEQRARQTQTVGLAEVRSLLQV